MAPTKRTARKKAHATDGLDEFGQQALADAQTTFSHDSKRLEDAALRYAFAVQREHGLRRMWFELGQPVLTQSAGREFPHPLLERIEKAEAHAQRLAEVFGLVPAGVKPRGMGRPQTRVPDAVSGEPPKLVALRPVS